MTMYGRLIFLSFLSLLILINGQRNDDRDQPPGRSIARAFKMSFDAQFQQGRCPSQFYQVGEECLYFSPEGKIYSWKQAERACSQRVARMVSSQSSSNFNQPNMVPTLGVRPLVLNTPEKTEILRAFDREYAEQNYGVRLPNDYNTLPRCQDGKDDKWPQFCMPSESTNSTCFEAVTNPQNDICLREVGCTKRYLRLACEFTLVGSPEITNSKFRTCPVARRGRRRLPKWAWITIIIGSALLVLVIIGAVVTFIRKGKSNGGSKKSKYSTNTYSKGSKQLEDRELQVVVKREDPAAKPMLTQKRPISEDDTGYLQADNTANA